MSPLEADTGKGGNRSWQPTRQPRQRSCHLITVYYLFRVYLLATAPKQYLIYTISARSLHYNKHMMDTFSDSFKREDIAAALVSMVTQDLAQSCHLTAMAHNIKSVYLCGSVVGTSQYLRTQMNQTLAVRGILNSLVSKLTKYGIYICVALVSTKII